jgi:hypothetical protein
MAPSERSESRGNQGEYVLRQSGGQLEVTRTASALGISRPTVESHLQAPEIPTRLRCCARFTAAVSRNSSSSPRRMRSIPAL